MGHAFTLLFTPACRRAKSCYYPNRCDFSDRYPRNRRRIMPNQIMAIGPYWLDEVATWVFDDPAAGLAQEPFVSGVPEMIDLLVKDIPDARRGFRLLFSAAPFPGYQKRFTRRARRWAAIGIQAPSRRWKAGSVRRCPATSTRPRPSSTSRPRPRTAEPCRESVPDC